MHPRTDSSLTAAFALSAASAFRAVVRAARTSRRVALGIVGTVLFAAAALAAPVLAQQPPVTGYARAGAEAQRALEAELITRISPALLDSFSFALTREPNVAGSPAQARTRDWVLERTRVWGLRSETAEYRVFLPWATEVRLEMTAPERRELELVETPIAGDSITSLPQYPLANGYSGAGAAEAEVVYVNYGLHEDYAVLDSLGVEVRGRIAVARYGRSYRGVKARLAEEHGAVGLLLYSDPADDGYARGPVYPHGTWRPSTGVQRGSIMNGTGDPTTPLRPSTPGAERDDPSPRVPSIPVVPVGYRVVEPILAGLDGAAPPDDWRGALPVAYRIGPGPVRLRLEVRDDRDEQPYKEIWNTVAWLPGTERPDEWIVIGAHRDAWGAGANDNASGTAAVLAAARALARLAADGHAPRRTIVFATWDAEEWGLIGSTEWVEEHADELAEKAVAYLNQDGIATGPSFGASASPSLKRLVREATAAVPAPGGRTLYDRWRERGPTTSACVVSPLPDAVDVVLGNLGGGSDYAGFYNHLGVPSAGWGFGGGWGQYHSAYDTYRWMSLYGDPGFVHHAAAARLTAVTALRLANAEVLPYDYREFACELRGEVRRLVERAGTARLGDVGLARLDSALARLEQASAAFAEARDAWLDARRPAAEDAPFAYSDGERADAANAFLMRVERELSRPEGLPGRPWYRHLIYASDPRNGYATLALPGVAVAIRDGDEAAAREETEDLAARVDRAAAHVEAAARALAGGS